jgi:hypothetical protein
MSNLTKNQLKTRVNNLSDKQIINILDCEDQLKWAIKAHPFARWRNILIDTLVEKIYINEIDEVELLIIEQGN